ncbi:MAG: hypothetical protein EBV10_09990 [Synechococcaceae bacterium WB6_1A_059]|nr:hypothetical protein [Synechococcaceae bacterium WB6_1A_059]
MGVLKPTGWSMVSMPAVKEDGHWYEMYRWVKENVPSNDYRYQGEGIFEFRNPQDLTMFLLKWSSND